MSKIRNNKLDPFQTKLYAYTYNQNRHRVSIFFGILKNYSASSLHFMEHIRLHSRENLHQMSCALRNFIRNQMSNKNTRTSHYRTYCVIRHSHSLSIPPIVIYFGCTSSLPGILISLIWHKLGNKTN